MIWFILGLIVLFAGLVGILLATETGAKILSGVVAVIIGGGLLILASTYTQDVGEAKVLKDWTGNIVGEDVTPGLAWKAPWVSTIDFDIRNQQVTYNNREEASDGPQITIQDSEGVRANFDVAVRYSIKANAVTDIYSNYQTQENFETRLINQDIRSVVRNAPSTYSTIEVLTKRAEIEQNILEGLEKRWADQGVQIESVALQEIRYPDDVMQKYADAQNARTEVVKAEAELEAAKVSSQQKVVQAEAEAKANETLAESLSPEILEQRRLDTLREIGNDGNLIVVPEGSKPFVQVKK